MAKKGEQPITPARPMLTIYLNNPNGDRAVATVLSIHLTKAQAVALNGDKVNALAYGVQGATIWDPISGSWGEGKAELRHVVLWEGDLVYLAHSNKYYRVRNEELVTIADPFTDAGGIDDAITKTKQKLANLEALREGEKARTTKKEGIED